MGIATDPSRSPVDRAGPGRAELGLIAAVFGGVGLLAVGAVAVFDPALWRSAAAAAVFNGLVGTFVALWLVHTARTDAAKVAGPWFAGTGLRLVSLLLTAAGVCLALRINPFVGDLEPGQRARAAAAILAGAAVCLSGLPLDAYLVRRALLACGGGGANDPRPAGPTPHGNDSRLEARS